MVEQLRLCAHCGQDIDGYTGGGHRIQGNLCYDCMEAEVPKECLGCVHATVARLGEFEFPCCWCSRNKELAIKDRYEKM